MKFIEDLKKELNKSNLSEEEVKEILVDFTEMVEEALESGLKEEELESKFGSPEKIAIELSGEHVKDENDNNTKDLKFSPNNEYKIVIELLNEDIFIEMTDSEEIIVEPKNVRRLKDFEISFENNTFILKKPKKQITGIFNFMKKGEFNITLPKSIIVKEMTFNNVNGDGKITNLDIVHTKFNITNGDFTFNKSGFNDLLIETINGDISLVDIEANQLKMSLISGDVTLNNIKVKNDFNLDSVSGDVEADNLSCNQAYVKLISGDFEANEFYPKELTIKTVSGDVDINNKNKDNRIEVIKKSTVNGNIEINQ